MSDEPATMPTQFLVFRDETLVHRTTDKAKAIAIRDEYRAGYIASLRYTVRVFEANEVEA